MTITKVPAVTGDARTPVIRRLVEAIVNWYRRMHQLVDDVKEYRLLKEVRIGTVPNVDPEPEVDDDETWTEPFIPEDWSGSTPN